MNTHTPKHFALQLGALLTLYVSITALIMLLFSIINITFPDAAEYYYEAESARELARGTIATLIVFFPSYLLLTRISNQARRRETGGEYTTLARWMIYLSLLVGGGIVLGDLVTLILYFLNGEITVRFLLKVAALAIVVACATTYYFLDVRGYFKQRVRHAVYFAAGTTVLVIASVITGFMNIETPSAVREMRLDDQQVGDFQDMQWRIEDYYRTNEVLPETLAAVYPVGDVPEAPEDRTDYRFEVTGETTYKMCATFAHSSQKDDDVRSLAYPIGLEKNYNWEHEAGEWCFERQLANIDQ